MKNKKIFIIIGLVLLVIAIIVIISNKKNSHIVDLSEIEKNVLRQYGDLDLVKQDKYSFSEYFGIDIDDENYLFYTDYVFNEDDPKPFSSDNILIIINTNNKEFYDIFNDYINYNIVNLNDSEKIDVYKKAILELKNDYLYFIVGFDNNINKIIKY